MRFTLFFTLFVLICACADEPVGRSLKIKPRFEAAQNYSAPELNPLPQSFKNRFYDSIQLYYKNRIQPGFNGMFLVAKNGQIVFERYQGVSNANRSETIDKHTPLHVASISKVITAFVILQMVQEKKIALDQDIRSVLPEILYDGITIRMLLNHRSGIPYYGYFSSKIWPATKKMSNASVLRVLNQQKMDLYFPPNTQFSYCNTNYVLLALIAERVDKKSFPDVVSYRIFKPLGMTHSFILHAGIKKDTISQSYDSKKRLQPFTNLDEVYGDKNVYTTARDLLKLDVATYSNAFLADSLKKEMFRGYSYERKGSSNYGLGFRMREEKGKAKFLFHTGWWHGNTGCYATLRSDTICMIVLSNHYNRSVYTINRLSMLFGNYPFAPLIDGRENFIHPKIGERHVQRYNRLRRKKR